jgi:hypothetical protein
VFTTAGTDDKVRFLDELTGGKSVAINYKTQGGYRVDGAAMAMADFLLGGWGADFEKEIKEACPEGIDLIVDFGECWPGVCWLDPVVDKPTDDPIRGSGATLSVGPNYWNKVISRSPCHA